MSGIWTLLAVGASLAAVARLAASDPKRRRVFGLPPTGRPRRARLLLGMALAPCAALAWLGTTADVVIWCGAVTTLGWFLVAIPPATQLSMAQAASGALAGMTVGRVGLRTPSLRGLAPLARRFKEGLGGLPPLRRVGAGADRIALLEALIAALEASLADRGAGGRGGGSPLPGEPERSVSRNGWRREAETAGVRDDSRGEPERVASNP